MSGNWLDRLVIAVDGRQRQRLGIWEFSDNPRCILRVGVATTHISAELSDGARVQPGDTVGLIHFWNERLPKIPATGAGLAWAREFKAGLVYSLGLLARYMVEERSPLDDIEVFGGELPMPFTHGTVRMLERLGFEVFDSLTPRGLAARLIDLGARTWTYLMRRAFNPGSLQGIGVGDMSRRPTWISRRRLIEIHLPDLSTDPLRPDSP